MQYKLMTRFGISVLAWCWLLLLTCLSVATCLADAAPKYQHGISLFHELKYPADFKHFDWVNPSAPKGGELVLATAYPIQSFSGTWGTSMSSAEGLGRTTDSLFVRSPEEPSVVYGELADGLALSADKKSLYVRLHEDAHWHDGVPLTTKDIQFSFDMFEKVNLGVNARLRGWLESMEIVNVREFVVHHRDVFTPSNLEDLRLLAILPAHYYVNREVGKATLEPPIGSGPYRVAGFDRGHVEYERVVDYWGRDLPVNRGRHNFDTIRYDVYRDASIARQAIKKGLFDVFMERSNLQWHSSYSEPSLRARGLLKGTHKMASFIGPQWLLVFNLDREKFSDVRVREALAMVFDFEWQNRVMHFNSQRRATSYFSDSPYAASGFPSKEELAILEPYVDQLDERVLLQALAFPVSTGRGLNRAVLERAHELLFEAGWTFDGGQLKDVHGQPLTVDITTQHVFAKRLLLPYVDALVSLGVDARLNLLDTVGANRHRNDRRFDLWLSNYSIPNPPFEYLFWFSSAVAAGGKTNYTQAIRDPVVDDLIERAKKATNLDEATVILRALDRVLYWGFYGIMLNALDDEKFIFSDKIGRPDDAQARFSPLQQADFSVIDSWWDRNQEGPRLDVK